MNEQQPTPETDDIFDTYARCACGTACIRAKMQQIERERDEARRNAEVERLSGVAVVAMCKRQESEIEAMREAIKEAHEALMLAPYRDQEALAKLQPFINP